MSSDSSTSGSDASSDEELDADVIKAFQAVKRNLISEGLKRSDNSTAKSKNEKSKTSTSTRHRLIYQTFKKDKVSSEKCEKATSSKQSEENDISGVKLNEFFIDKGPACKQKAENDDLELDNITAYDLTKFSVAVDVHTEYKEVDDIESYDLTNIDDSVNEPLENKNLSDSSDNNTDSENEKEEIDHLEQQRLKKERKMKNRKEKGLLSSKLEADVAVKDVYINVNPLSKSRSSKTASKDKQRHKEPEIMKKSVITDDFERQDSIQTTHVSVRQQKKQRKLEKEKTKGGKWFNMPATELTDERKYDLTVLQMRKALDPKRFYKANDLKAAPKYFQFGQVVEDATDFYSSRIPKKQRKSTVVEELLADAEFRKFNKRKYEEVQDAKRHGKGPYKHMKRLKKRKK